MWQPLDVDGWVDKRRIELRNVQSPVHDIIEMVRAKGDEALIELTERFDRVKLSSIRVSEEEVEAAYEQVDPALIEQLRRAAGNIERYHVLQLEAQNWMKEVEPGVLL
ncbi:MAG: histidinol dehydrogenase, partial [Methanomassiliicoccales archaeon]|nr:histidinol dehydrogenase [Methanomassiliicoccales archaeon]